MPYVERDGVRIFYDAAGTGPCVLLSHGYSATSQMWAAQVAALREQYRVVVWDMRGHGHSDSPEDLSQYSEAYTVADMAAILDACDCATAVIGGLSLGGYMSLAFYRTHPERARALMLFDTGPGFKNDEAREQWNQRAEQWAQMYESKGLSAVGPSAEMQLSTHRSAHGLARAARGMLAQKNDAVIQSLPNVNVPALVLVGADDTPFLAATDYMAKKIPGATKIVIPGARHAANIDQPVAFNEAVRAFLAKVFI